MSGEVKGRVRRGGKGAGGNGKKGVAEWVRESVRGEREGEKGVAREQGGAGRRVR